MKITYHSISNGDIRTVTLDKAAEQRLRKSYANIPADTKKTWPTFEAYVYDVFSFNA